MRKGSIFELSTQRSSRMNERKMYQAAYLSVLSLWLKLDAGVYSDHVYRVASSLRNLNHAD